MVTADVSLNPPEAYLVSQLLAFLEVPMSSASKDSFIFPFCACNLFSFYLPGHNGCIMWYGRIDIPVPIPEENVTSFTVERAINCRGLSCTKCISLKTVLSFWSCW